MVVKLHVNLHQGILDVEGDQAFVEKMLAEFKSNLSKFVEKPAPSETPDNGGGANGGGKKARQKTSGGKKGGPSCAERISAIKQEGFFKALRTGKEIREKLEEKGTAYASNQVAAALIHMVKRNDLRRVKKDGSWWYQNP